jgi:hypothetical protein
MSSFQEQELEAIKKELNILKKNQANIEYENKQQKILVEYFCYNIMEYLYECNNIKKTAEYFGCDIKYLYSKIVLWGGCSETLTDREDYNDYHYKFDGRLCEIYELESDDIKMRTPEKEELNLPKYVSLVFTREKPHLVFEKRVDGNRLGLKMVLPIEYDLQEQISILNEKIGLKYTGESIL